MVFAPVLFVSDVAASIAFYKKALSAVELRRWTNDDGSVHVAELSLEGTLFHIHEDSPPSRVNPQRLGSTGIELGVFAADPDAVMRQALLAGAKEANAMQDYEYGYRQGSFVDPFGHYWTVQKKI